MENPYSVLGFLQREVAAACEALPKRFESPEGWQAYRKELTQALGILLPVFPMPGKGVFETHISAGMTDGILCEHLAVRTAPGLSAAVLLYRPENRENCPAVLVCPGYGQGKQEKDITDICRLLASRGYVTAAADYTATGEAAVRPDFASDINNHDCCARLLGWTDIGMRVMTNRALFAALREHPQTDPGRIGITGLCQGSIVTWFTAAVTEGFKAAALLCGLTTYEAVALEYMNRQGGWGGPSAYLTGLLRYGDIQHVAACFAPNPLLIINNLIDRHWPLSGCGKAYDFLKNIYGLYGAGDRLSLYILDCAHAYAEPANTVIADFFDANL